ncbi:MAG: hypothetical protein AB1450_07615 [Pseudomonadota bacterium]
MMRRVLLTLALLPAGVFAAEPLPTWEGWIVGRPCAGELRVADCPLRHIDDPVLLLESGAAYPFSYGGAAAVRVQDVDQAYSKKVRLTGNIADGAIQAVRMDVLETSGARTFFKGCL